MRIQPGHYERDHRCRQQQRGMAVIVVMVIISILLIYVAGNLRTLHLLRKDLKLVEQKQIVRLQKASVGTNSVQVTNGTSPVINSNRFQGAQP